MGGSLALSLSLTLYLTPSLSLSHTHAHSLPSLFAMARVMFAVVVALMAVSASSAFRVINLDNGGISGEEVSSQSVTGPLFITLCQRLRNGHERLASFPAFAFCSQRDYIHLRLFIHPPLLLRLLDLLVFA